MAQSHEGISPDFVQCAEKLKRHLYIIKEYFFVFVEFHVSSSILILVLKILWFPISKTCALFFP